MHKRSLKIGHLISASIFTLLSILMCVEDIRFSYDILYNDQSEFWMLYLLIFLWASIGIFTPYISKWHVVIFLTLICFRSIYGWPLNIMISNNTAVIFSDVLLLMASLAYLAFSIGLLGNNERPTKFNAKHFGLSILNIHLIPGVFVVLGFFGLSQAVCNFSGGHIKLTGKGMTMQNLVMENPEGKRVHLIGMIHMGKSSYYDEVKETWQGGSLTRKLVLHEGVSDKEGVLKSKIDYSLVASILGLDNQPSLAESPTKAGSAGSRLEGEFADHVNADIDLSELPEEGAEFLDEILSIMSVSDLQSLMENMKSVKLTDTETAAFMEESLLEFRNDRLMQVLNEKLPEYDEIYIPWGALHLKDIENRLRQQNFTETGQSFYTAFRWSDVFDAITRE